MVRAAGCRRIETRNNEDIHGFTPDQTFNTNERRMPNNSNLVVARKSPFPVGEESDDALLCDDGQCLDISSTIVRPFITSRERTTSTLCREVFYVEVASSPSAGQHVFIKGVDPRVVFNAVSITASVHDVITGPIKETKPQKMHFLLRDIVQNGPKEIKQLPLSDWKTNVGGFVSYDIGPLLATFEGASSFEVQSMASCSIVCEEPVTCEVLRTQNCNLDENPVCGLVVNSLLDYDIQITTFNATAAGHDIDTEEVSVKEQVEDRTTTSRMPAIITHPERAGIAGLVVFVLGCVLVAIFKRCCEKTRRRPRRRIMAPGASMMAQNRMFSEDVYVQMPYP